MGDCPLPCQRRCGIWHLTAGQPLPSSPLPQAAPLFPQLLRRALELVRECGCSSATGCPACVQHTECGEYNAALHKTAAALVLEALLDPEGGGAAGREAPAGVAAATAEQQQQQQQPP